MSLMQTNLFRNALASPGVVAVLKRVVPPLDRLLLRCTRGYVNTAMQPVALLTTLGARSGQARPIATMCMPVKEGFLLVGSNWGADRDPAWVHNLRASPPAQFMFRGYVGPVIARELTGTERERHWQALTAYNPQYVVYQKGTRRLLPVMLLEKSGAVRHS